MDYDFSTLCADQLDKLQKRLESLHKSFIKEYKFAMNIINQHSDEERTDVSLSIDKRLADNVDRVTASYAATFNDIQKILSRNL